MTVEELVGWLDGGCPELLLFDNGHMAPPAPHKVKDFHAPTVGAGCRGKVAERVIYRLSTVDNRSRGSMRAVDNRSRASMRSLHNSKFALSH